MRQDAVKNRSTGKTIQRGVRLLLGGISHLLWPSACIRCDSFLYDDDRVLCRDCWSELSSLCGPDYCRRCGREASSYALVAGRCPDCQGKEFHFDGIARAGVYLQGLRDMILAFKNGRIELEEVLGFLANSALAGAGFYQRLDFFVPVPLHWSRRLRRGYNQSLLIAKQLKHPRAKVNTDLVRIRRTQEQLRVASFAARARNIAGAFAVRRGHNFAGSRICLVDDIKTSGATLNECAATLKAAGAVEVNALVLAVAGQEPG